MNVSELYQLALWVDKHNEKQIIQHDYEYLINALNHNGQPFEREKESLFSTLKGITLEELSGEQVKFLKNINIFENIGLIAIEKIEDVLFRNVIDRQTARDKISKMFIEIKKGIEKLNSIKINLQGLVDDEQYEAIDEVLMRVGFMGDVSINNIEDFKKLGVIWHDIGRGIAMSQNKSPKDIKIIGATKGSVILECMINTALVSSFMLIIKQGLTITEKIYNVKKLKAEAKLADINIKEFDNKIKELKENTVRNILQELINKLGLSSDSQGDKKIALEKSVQKLIDFLTKGGDIDFVLKEESEADNQEIKKLREEVREIRELEGRIVLLENKKQ